MQGLGLDVQQQQQRQQHSQLVSGDAPGMGALQHPGQSHLNNLASANNSTLLSLIYMGANGMWQQNNHLMNNLLRNNNMLDSNNLNRLDPLMNEQLQVIHRARNSVQAQGGAGAAANQQTWLPNNDHNSSPLLTVPHDQNSMMQQGLNRSPRPGNPAR
ncbi:hypothetical protein BDV93DRAFT_49056 [Ceratobasidium sp. AG-I]|nr:hypothetical protein BDV93DRAFT_49056 [Ceratobasidium sp. AG-I]